jgi:hypothetical protein
MWDNTVNLIHHNTVRLSRNKPEFPEHALRLWKYSGERTALAGNPESHDQANATAIRGNNDAAK